MSDNFVIWAFGIVVIGGLAIAIIWAICIMANNSREASQKRELREKYSPTLQPLVLFAGRYDTGLLKVVKKARTDLGDEDLSEKRLLLFDLTVLIRKIAIPNDEIRFSDAEMLRVYCWDSNEWELSSSDTYVFLKLIRDFEEEKLLTLQGMQMLDSPGTQELAKIYLKLAKSIANTSARKAALKVLQGEIKEILNPARKPSADEIREDICRIAENLLKDHQDEIDRAIKEEKDPRYGILGVKTSCSMEDIEKAYRLKSIIFDPDKLSLFSSELEQHGEQLMAVLNGAYESLCAEYK